MGKDKKKKDKERLQNLNKQAVSMREFLKRFLHVDNDELIEYGLTHNDLRKIFPNLKRTSFDVILDDPSVVYTGEVILVLDASEHVVPYVSKELKTLESFGIDDAMDKSEWEKPPEQWGSPKQDTPNIHDYDLKSMSIYELEILLKLYSYSNQMSSYYTVRREIVSRSDSHQGNKRSKQKSLKKENKRNKKDKY